MLLVMIWLLTLSYGVGGLLLIRQNFRSSLEQYENICAESYEMLLQSVQLVNFVDIQQDFSSISTALERMNTADSLVGISLIRGDRILYQNGESKSDYDTESEFESFLFTRDGRHLYQINGVIKTNEKPLELVILYDVTPVYQARDDQLEVYHQVLIVLILIGGLAAWITSFLITKPLYKLSRTARELSSGHYDSRVNSKSHDEIGQLGSDFDNMAEKLEDNITELRMSMEQQERFMGSFAHELKTPLAVTQLYVDNWELVDDKEREEAAVKILKILPYETAYPDSYLLSPIEHAIDAINVERLTRRQEDGSISQDEYGIVKVMWQAFQNGYQDGNKELQDEAVSSSVPLDYTQEMPDLSRILGGSDTVDAPIIDSDLVQADDDPFSLEEALKEVSLDSEPAEPLPSGSLPRIRARTPEARA